MGQSVYLRMGRWGKGAGLRYSSEVESASFMMTRRHLTGSEKSCKNLRGGLLTSVMDAVGGKERMQNALLMQDSSSD